MKTTNSQNFRFVIIALFAIFCQVTNAQIGINTAMPTSTIDVVAKNPTGTTTSVDGILIPRITRQRAQSMTTIPTATMVYINETTTGTLSGTTIDVFSEGFYFYNGSKWIAVGSDKNWSTTGNSGTTTVSNYIGTTDAVNLQLRTAGAERMVVSGTTGNIAIGTSTIPPSTRLEVSSGATNDGIYGHSDNVGGTLGREINISFGTPAQTLFGAGVYASNPAAGYTSSFAQSSGGATVAANINYSNVWIPSFNFCDNASNAQNPPGLYAQLNNSGTTLLGFQNAIQGYNNRATTAGNTGYSVGISGTASAQNQDSFGVIGQAFCNTSLRTGGYFESYNYAGTVSTQSYAFVGANTGSSIKIIGTGTVSEIIPTEKHGRITLTCPESPEYWYQDYGTVQMTKGKATIILDDILADVSVIDQDNPIRVICTPVAMPFFNGITIMSQTSKSVEILELNGGSHSGKLQYQLVVKPKTNYGEGRFQQAPGPAYLKADKEPIAAKAKNQPNDGRKIYHWPADELVYKYNPEDFTAIGDVISAGPNAGKIKLGNGKYSNGVPAKQIKE